MNLMDLLASAGGNSSIEKLGGQLGLDGADTGKLVSAVAPSLLEGFRKQGQSAAGFAGLAKALGSGQHQRYIDEPDRVTDESTTIDGNKILGHLFGSKEVSRNVAAEASRSSGIDASLIRKSLPILAGLAMGAMSKKTDAGGSMGGLGTLLGGLSDDNTPGMDGLLGMARKLF